MRLFKLLIALLCVIPSVTQASHIEISEAQINHYLHKKLESSKRFSLPGLIDIHYQVEQIQAKVGQNADNRIELNGIVSARFNYNNQSFNSQINLAFDVEPEYNPKQGAVYLKNLRVLRWSSKPQQYAAQLQTIMPMLNSTAQMLLNKIPVYTLDTQDQTQNLIKNIVKTLTVHKGKVLLETSSSLF